LRETACPAGQTPLYVRPAVAEPDRLGLPGTLSSLIQSVEMAVYIVV
jgi:hypothetical protein